ncbi:MAG: hypothetical protein JWO98_4756 [Frankiales bacterium]|nr:hypothetical protein [Frankiales bacterium]
MTAADKPLPVADRILARLHDEAAAIDAELTARPINLADCPNCACCDEWCGDDVIGECPIDAVGDSTCPCTAD